MTALDPTEEEYERAVAARWGPRDTTVRSFWQNPVALSEISRRITGDAEISPPQHFIRTYCPSPRRRGLSLGCGDAGLELNMLALGACERMVAVDISQARLDRASAAMPPELADRLELVCANIEQWRPEGSFDLVIANGVLHHLERLERVFDLFDAILTDDGLVYLDEFVGPSRFQWTDKQLSIINRLLERLSPELRRDLVLPELGVRPPVTRPSAAGLIAADPSEAARSHELPGLLYQRLEVVEEREWGGAIFHQLFNRIMGNFSGQEDLIRVLMEFDAILTDEGVVGSDYLWGVYRRRGAHTGATAPSGVDGRVESIEGHTVVGWAVHAAEPGRRVAIDAFVDHKLVAKTIADLPRSDLAREGIGDGMHAFRIELPSWACDGGHHSLSVADAGGAGSIAAARGWAQRNRTEPDATVFSFATRGAGFELPTSRVLAGLDGWAFPCDDAVGSVEQMVGRLTLSHGDLRRYRELIARRTHRLADRGIVYVVAVVPAKAAVHPDRLAPSVPALGPPTLGAALMEALSDSGATVVSLLPALRAAAQAGRPTHCKRDRHWSYEGAVVGAEALLDAILDRGVPVVTTHLHATDWIQEQLHGDLAGRPTVTLEDGHFQRGGASGGAEVVLRPDEGKLGLRRVGVPGAVQADHPDAIAIESGRHPQAPTAVILGDQDQGRLQPVLASAFSRSIWVSGWELDDALLHPRPAVVIQVIDEPELVRVPYAVGG